MNYIYKLILDRPEESGNIFETPNPINSGDKICEEIGEDEYIVTQVIHVHSEDVSYLHVEKVTVT